MTIQIDTREHTRAIEKIVAEFEQQKVNYVYSKMYVGDYCDLANPLLIIDRKHDIAEIAANATSGHARLKRELKRLDDIDGRMIFLIEQDTIAGKPIESLEDIILWKPKFGTIMGPQIFKVLDAWRYKHSIDYAFCKRRDTGSEIIRILGEK